MGSRAPLLLLAVAGCDAATDITTEQGILLMMLFMGLNIAGAISGAGTRIAEAIRDMRDHKVQLDTRSQIDVRVRGDDGKPVRTQAVEDPRVAGEPVGPGYDRPYEGRGLVQ